MEMYAETERASAVFYFLKKKKRSEANRAKCLDEKLAMCILQTCLYIWNTL